MMKMKNKKLFARILAFAFALVLVFALAIPCFADEIDPPPTDYFYNRVNSYIELLSYLNSSDSSSLSAIGFESAIGGRYGIAEVYLLPLSTTIVVNYAVLSVSGYQFNEFLIYDDDSIVFTYSVIEDGVVSENETLNITWSDVEFYILVPVPADDGTIIEEQGWYGQIKNIIKDAVFGSDTILNDSQEFTLNQIALWLSLIVILLPLVLVAVILVRCFR